MLTVRRLMNKLKYCQQDARVVIRGRYGSFEDVDDVCEQPIVTDLHLHDAVNSPHGDPGDWVDPPNEATEIAILID